MPRYPVYDIESPFGIGEKENLSDILGEFLQYPAAQEAYQVDPEGFQEIFQRHKKHKKKAPYQLPWENSMIASAIFRLGGIG